jgi:hypothetical protein
VTLFAGPERFGGDAVRVPPIFGLGFGFASFRPVDIALDGESRLMVVLAARFDRAMTPWPTPPASSLGDGGCHR